MPASRSSASITCSCLCSARETPQSKRASGFADRFDAFRAGEFGFARALHFRSLAGGGGLPVELKSAGCQTSASFRVGAGGDDVMAHMLAGFLATGSPMLEGCSPISFIFAAQIVW
jgi:hypothetical protein